MLAVVLGAGAGLGTVESLAGRGELRRPYWTGPQHPRPMQRLSVLRGSTQALGRPGGFRVLLGEEDRGTPAHLGGQSRR